MNNLTWTCHVCGTERPDDMIDVAVRTGLATSGAVIRRNVRYCADNPECKRQAMMAAHNHVHQFGEALNPCACGSGRQRLLLHGTEVTGSEGILTGFEQRMSFQCEDCFREGPARTQHRKALEAWNHHNPYTVRNSESSDTTQHAR